MSYPILYSATETNFDHNGIGILSACVSCEVTEEANGIFELAMTYPIDGIHFDKIGDRAIIKAKSDQFRQPQLFRVYAISKPMNGIVTVLAEHISYDLSGIPVKPFSASMASSALTGLKNNAVIDCPFDFWTDKATSANFKVSTPASIRSRLGGVAGSILDVYGGEYEFDNYTVKLHNNRGQNRGVSIRYGKNLTDIQQDQNCSNVATGVYPYWADAEGKVLVELPERIINAPGTYNFVKIRTLDLSSEFETQPTVEQLRSKTQSYIKANNIGVPSVSLTVSFAQLEQTEEYKHLKLLERVSLFDTVNVEFPALGVSATARAVKVVYDGSADRVKSVTLGSVRANIADTIANQSSAIEQNKTETRTQIQKAQEAATAWLTNGKGYAYFRKDDLGNIKDILFMDTQDPETAVNVMRVGQSGIGFSHSGVNGLYESAWTIDGKFNADFIYSGSISASIIKGGTMLSEGKAKLRPTREDCVDMLFSVTMPDAYPPKPFYDLNGDGVFDRNDVVLALNVLYGESDVSECVSLEESTVTVIIEPSNSIETVKIYGTNMWGSDIVVSLGINSTKIPSISNDCSVGGVLSVRESAVIPQIAFSEGETPKTLSWKDNGDGTFTPIGQ
jgi:phage minor structural protein